MANRIRRTIIATAIASTLVMTASGSAVIAAIDPDTYTCERLVTKGKGKKGGFSPLVCVIVTPPAEEP